MVICGGNRMVAPASRGIVSASIFIGPGVCQPIARKELPPRQALPHQTESTASNRAWSPELTLSDGCTLAKTWSCINQRL